MMQSLDRTCDILDNVTYTPPSDAHIGIPQERERGLAYQNGQKIQMRFRGLFFLSLFFLAKNSSVGRRKQVFTLFMSPN